MVAISVFDEQHYLTELDGFSLLLMLLGYCVDYDETATAAIAIVLGMMMVADNFSHSKYLSGHRSTSDSTRLNS